MHMGLGSLADALPHRDIGMSRLSVCSMLKCLRTLRYMQVPVCQSPPVRFYVLLLPPSNHLHADTTCPVLPSRLCRVSHLTVKIGALPMFNCPFAVRPAAGPTTGLPSAALRQTARLSSLCHGVAVQSARRTQRRVALAWQSGTRRGKRRRVGPKMRSLGLRIVTSWSAKTTPGTHCAIRSRLA